MSDTTQNTPPAAIEAYLVTREGGEWHDIFRLAPGTMTTLGRDPANRIVLNDEKCSRRHCDVYFENGRWVIRDLSSRNGTRVNGERIASEYTLQSNDVVRIGNIELLFTPDISQPLDGRSDMLSAEPAETEEHDESSDDAGAQILQRKSQTRYLNLTESRIYDTDHEPQVRDALAKLYVLVVDMVSATDVKSLSERILDGLLATTRADIGAVLLFSSEAADRTDPDGLRIIAYQSPADTPYHKVSGRLSKAALTEREAILGLDIATETSEFKTLSDMQAESVICVPIRHDEAIFGLLHLYALQAENALDTESLEFAMAVADRFALTLSHLNQKEVLTGELKRAFDQNRSLRRLLEIESDLVGDSPPMRQLRDTIGRVAHSDATALVRGESGVGKELVARAIHFNSARRDATFVCMNCAALTETLLESELFGHEKGAFTGATRTKIGKFEQADGGTLFLDEVGDMPMSIQAKFLRVLEGHPFERVGGNSDICVDVRVVAATNRELETAVDARDFRKDLFFRLQILEICVPPLREHASDVPALANFFLDRCCQRIGRPLLSFSPEALQVLGGHDWPGNVRELRNVIERTVVLTDSQVIQADDVRLFSNSEARPEGQDKSTRPYEPVTLDAIEREHIVRTLEWTGWNKREAARILEINRSTLDRKLDRYGVRPPAEN